MTKTQYNSPIYSPIEPVKERLTPEESKQLWTLTLQMIGVTLLLTFSLFPALILFMGTTDALTICFAVLVCLGVLCGLMIRTYLSLDRGKLRQLFCRNMLILSAFIILMLTMLTLASLTWSVFEEVMPKRWL